MSRKPYYVHSEGGFYHGPGTYEWAMKQAAYANSQRWEGEPLTKVYASMPTTWQSLFGRDDGIVP